MKQVLQLNTSFLRNTILKDTVVLVVGKLNNQYMQITDKYTCK